MAVALAALGTSGVAGICEEGSAPVYPVEQFLLRDGLEMDVLLFPYAFDTSLPSFDRETWQSLKGLPQSTLDVLLLSYLDALMVEGIALDRWVTLWPNALWTAVMDGLERHGLTAQKAELERLPGLVPQWQAGPEARTARIIELWNTASEERLRLEPQILDVIRRYGLASPPVAEVLVRHIEATPELAAYYAQRRMSVGDETKLHWLGDALLLCLNEHPWEQGQPLPIEALPSPRKDVLLMAMLHRDLVLQIAHVYYQPVDPSLGFLLSQMAQAVGKAGLSEEADLLRKVGSARDRTEAQNLLAWLDPAGILRAAKSTAKSAGFWPE